MGHWHSMDTPNKHTNKTPQIKCVSRERRWFAVPGGGGTTSGWLFWGINWMMTQNHRGGPEANHQEGKRLLDLIIWRMVEELEDSEKRGLRKNVSCFQTVKWFACCKNLDSFCSTQKSTWDYNYRQWGFSCMYRTLESGLGLNSASAT